MKKIALSILSAAVLTGCVDARHVQDPQGQDYLHIKCSSLNTNKPVTAKCQARATKECPGGYIVIHNTMSPFSNENSMILECDRNANNAHNNISRYTAFGSLLNAQIELSKNQPNQEYTNFHNIRHAISEKNTQAVYTNAPQYQPQTAVPVAEKTATAEKTVTSNKNGAKEITTVKKTSKVSKKDKKA